MQRARRLVGMAVRSVTGETLGEVRDVILDAAARKVMGLAVVTGSLVRRPRYVRRTEIIDVSDKGVTVRSADSLITNRVAGRGLEHRGSPLGKTVEAYDGRTLGHVRDILLDLNRLSVWGFEVSEGLVSDVLDGLTRFPRRTLERVGERMMFHPYHMKRREDGNSTPRGGERQ